MIDRIAANRRGFTLVEFLLSVAMFSFFIVFVLVGFVQINRSYSRGITVKQVQQSARALLEDISRSMQSVGQAPEKVTGPPVLGALNIGYRYCLDDANVKYSWNQFNGIASDFTRETYSDDTSNIFSLVKSDIGGGNCSDPVRVGSGNSEELIPSSLKIQSLDIEGISRPGESYDTNFRAYKVRLLVAVDDDELVEQLVNGSGDVQAQCNTDPGSNQFCDVVEYSTIVTLRN